MKLENLSSTLEALIEADVKFLIAGGLAVIAHGHSRVTHDLDIVLALDSDNTSRAMNVLTELGYCPRIPVEPGDFCDEEKRMAWVREKNLQVFSMLNESFEGLVLDVFAEEPFDFDKEYLSAHRAKLPGLKGDLPFVSKEALLLMKRQAGRAIDQDDIKHLSES